MFKAACDGDLPLVDYHVSNGVDVNYVHPEILGTALVASILAQQEPVAMFLLENGADPNLLSEFEGLTPVQASRKAGLESVEARLLELGAQVPVQSSPTEVASAEPTRGNWLFRLLSGRR